MPHEGTNPPSLVLSLALASAELMLTSAAAEGVSCCSQSFFLQWIQLLQLPQQTEGSNLNKHTLKSNDDSKDHFKHYKAWENPVCSVLTELQSLRGRSWKPLKTVSCGFLQTSENTTRAALVARLDAWLWVQPVACFPHVYSCLSSSISMHPKTWFEICRLHLD